MKTQHYTIELEKAPTVQDIIDLFPASELYVQRTITHGSYLIKAERKFVMRYNQVKSNLLHVYLWRPRLNCWEHLVETKDGSLKPRDWESPRF